MVVARWLRRLEQLLDRLGIRREAWLVIGAAGLAAAAVGAVALGRLAAMDDAGRGAYAGALATSDGVTRLEALAWQTRYEALAEVAAGERGISAAHGERAAAGLRGVRSAVSELGAQPLTTAQAAAVGRFSAAWQRYVDARTAVRRLTARGDVAAAERADRTRLVPAADAAATTLHALSDATRRAVDAGHDRAGAAVVRARVELVLATVTGLLGSTALLRLLAGVLAGRVRRWRDAVVAGVTERAERAARSVPAGDGVLAAASVTLPDEDGGWWLRPHPGRAGPMARRG